MSTPDRTRNRSSSLETYVATGALLPASAALQAFVSDARAHSGLDPAGLDPRDASYSLLLPDGAMDSLSLDAPVSLEGETLSLSDLLAPQLRYDQVSLSKAVWALESFEAMGGFLRALRVLVRYSRAEPEAGLLARVMPVAATLRLIEQIQRGEALNSSGEPLVDAVSRMLGLRRKLLLLDYNRRLQEGGDRGAGLLARTRNRLTT